jgi:hypothetical protein
VSSVVDTIDIARAKAKQMRSEDFLVGIEDHSGSPVSERKGK